MTIASKDFVHIYYLNNNYLIDFKTNEHCYSLSKKERSLNEEKYQITPFRKFNQITDLKPITILENFQDKRFFKKGPFLLFGNKTFMVYNNQYNKVKTIDSLHIDYLIMEQFEPKNIIDLQNTYHPNEFIFLLNKDLEKINESTKICKQNQLNCFFINQDYTKTIHYEKFEKSLVHL